MKLIDLKPQFIRYKTVGAYIYHVKVDKLEEAQGIRFLCPLCYQKNGGIAGTHSVICWSRSRGVPEEAQPSPGRWSLVGTGIHDLTLNGDAVGGGGARSVQLLGGCSWHGFVTNGEVI